ncbi:MAG: hypothetical protein II926_07365 [Bacteroidales bacterium]|nr:hypothetical protein [Bacteroidales bacterium]
MAHIVIAKLIKEHVRIMAEWRFGINNKLVRIFNNIIMKKIILLSVLSISISMAYSQITVTPKYTPMTYDELYAPIRAYEEAIKNFADRLFSDMDYVSEMMSKDIDNTLYYQLKADYENLDRLRVKVRNNGLSNSARTELSNIESQYRREIMEYYERKRR